jgi:hypothetical protein
VLEYWTEAWLELHPPWGIQSADEGNRFEFPVHGLQSTVEPQGLTGRRMSCLSDIVKISGAQKPSIDDFGHARFLLAERSCRRAPDRSRGIRIALDGIPAPQPRPVGRIEASLILQPNLPKSRRHSENPGSGCHQSDRSSTVSGILF